MFRGLADAHLTTKNFPMRLTCKQRAWRLSKNSEFAKYIAHVNLKKTLC